VAWLKLIDINSNCLHLPRIR